ncbi:MAG: glutathione S-transferase C-terminal domain-containing protein [Pseudomonadota bacterium]
MKVYGSRVSYYTGKLEAYLRYRNIPYTLHGMPYDKARMLREKVGSIQMPIVDREDGRWMSDTTPILLALEGETSGAPIIPADPVGAFIAMLIEDYGDEWLWRSAMHYRWNYPYSRELLSNILVDELTTPAPFPRFIVRRMIRRRQIRNFTTKDGVTAETRAHVEQGYLNALDGMSEVLRRRPFILGSQPSLADFGLMAPMFRHFSQDPDPEEIMRKRAPLVYEWVARMWAAQPVSDGGFVAQVTEEMQPLLKEVCETHLQQLASNAAAYADGRTVFEMTVQTVPYKDMPISRYRVYCLECLRTQFAVLDAESQAHVRALLPYPEAEILWQDELQAASDYNVDGHLPYGHAINVYGRGTPGS